MNNAGLTMRVVEHINRIKNECCIDNLSDKEKEKMSFCIDNISLMLDVVYGLILVVQEDEGIILLESDYSYNHQEDLKNFLNDVVGPITEMNNNLEE